MFHPVPLVASCLTSPCRLSSLSRACSSRSSWEAEPEKVSPASEEASGTRGEQGGESDESDERGDSELIEWGVSDRRSVCVRRPAP